MCAHILCQTCLRSFRIRFSTCLKDFWLTSGPVEKAGERCITRASTGRKRSITIQVRAASSLLHWHCAWTVEKTCRARDSATAPVKERAHRWDAGFFCHLCILLCKYYEFIIAYISTFGYMSRIINLLNINMRQIQLAQVVEYLANKRHKLCLEVDWL